MLFGVNYLAIICIQVLKMNFFIIPGIPGIPENMEEKLMDFIFGPKLETLRAYVYMKPNFLGNALCRFVSISIP